MTNSLVALVVAASVIVAAGCRKASDAPTQAPATPMAQGSVRGHVRLEGPVPENEAVRMNADPMCRNAVGGRRVVDESVIASPDAIATMSAAAPVGGKS